MGGALGQSAGRLSRGEVEPESRGRLDECHESSMLADVVIAGEGGVRGKVYSGKIPTEAGWQRQVVRFFEKCFLISSPSRYR